MTTRPTGARVRRTFFDVIAGVIPGCRFLDPFAGSGAIGLEALSRGAARVVLLDRNPQAIEAIRHNVEAFGADTGQVRVYRRDAAEGLRVLAQAGELFDVIYLDPPYDTQEYGPLLAASQEVLAEGGVVTVEHFHKRALPETIETLTRTKQSRVGDHRLSFFRRDE